MGAYGAMVGDLLQELVACSGVPRAVSWLGLEKREQIARHKTGRGYDLCAVGQPDGQKV